MEDKKARILESCTFCGACVNACPFGAILLEKKEKRTDLSSYQGVWMFAEQREGEIMPVTYELLSIGRKLADVLIGATSIGRDLAPRVATSDKQSCKVKI